MPELIIYMIDTITIYYTVPNFCVLCVLCIFMKTVIIVRLYLSVSHVFVPHFVMSAWRLKCTKTMGPNSDVVH